MRADATKSRLQSHDIRAMPDSTKARPHQHGELQPVAILHARRRGDRHQRTIGWREQFGQPGAVLIREHDHLPGSPIRSDMGTSTGIVSTACPLTLGTGPCTATCTSSMPSAESTTGKD